MCLPWQGAGCILWLCVRVTLKCINEEVARGTGPEAGNAWGRWAGGSGLSMAKMARAPVDHAGAGASAVSGKCETAPYLAITEVLRLWCTGLRTTGTNGLEAGGV